MALNFKITNAGLSLLSQVSTIGPVTITKVGIGTAGYTPSGSETALTTQLKQITPEGSSVPSPGIIHITASDSTTDAYVVKEIGLFAGSTLFAVCSQTTAILTKSSGNVALFSIDLAISNVPAGSVTIGAASFQYPPATESAQGVAEIATSAEVAAATDDTRIVTPAKLGNFPGFVKKSGDTMTGALVLPGDPTSGLQAATKNYVDARSGVDTVPIGTIHWFTRNTPPDSYLECNGQAVSRTEYDVLFSRVGTTFGAGNGSTTFNLPDLRGEFIRGWDNGRGVDVSRIFGSSQVATGIGHVGTDANSNQLALSFDGSDAIEFYNFIGRYDSGQAPTASQRRARVRPRNVALLPCIKGKTLTNVDANLLGIAAQIYVPLTALVGEVSAFARTSAPDGWLKANGAAINRVTYGNLFSAIGTTFGAGNGSTTFNLPDLRGEFPRGWDDSRGVDSGRAFGSAQADDFKSHAHNLSNIASIPTNSTTVTQEPLLTENTTTSVASNVSGYILATGGTETRPRNIALLYCIKF